MSKAIIIIALVACFVCVASAQLWASSLAYPSAYGTYAYPSAALAAPAIAHTVPAAVPAYGYASYAAYPSAAYILKK
ncbi:hypothetical protein GZH46_00466 [Fragariocoptes setiger]|uniref:Uncharacterized protein n=1 Tax=Fragariocoptes setiger TaxID=1670756 RepID=A0ABQ7SCL7_9ACAR|nr:hypothetical protein GZH46_00466 [Fragariocoptes setiger]